MNELADRLREEFRNKDYRHAYTDSFLNSSIATQIKVLREQRGWSQGTLAEKAGMKQSRISLLENVHYSSWSLSTLRRLAEAFDLTIRVSFESFSGRLVDIIRFGRESLERFSFDEDPAFAEPPIRELNVSEEIGVHLSEAAREPLYYHRDLKPENVLAGEFFQAYKRQGEIFEQVPTEQPKPMQGLSMAGIT